MASASPSLIRPNEQEYLSLDRENDYRSEYIHGTMLAMAGGTLRHSAVAGNCGAQLNEKLAGSSCTVFNSDVRVRTPSSGSYVYPDVSVVLGSVLTHESANDILVNPCLIIEVLSPSTKRFDRGDKFDLYREIESVKECLLVHTDAMTVEHYSRQADNSWIYRETKDSAGAVFIPALQITLPLEKIYGHSMNMPG
jgi:Uma2 family endonuclease